MTSRTPIRIRSTPKAQFPVRRDILTVCWLSAFLAPALVGASQSGSPGAAAGKSLYRVLAGERFEAAIVPEQEAPKFSIPAAGGRTDVRYWTPADEDILKLEQGLKRHLKKVARKEAPWNRLDEYKRQYVGYVLAGRKRIFGNFFCEAPSDWTSLPVVVMDGGSCYFTIDYDAESARFLNVFVHAP